MGQAFILIAMGFSFALIGLGNILVSLTWHIPISDPLQWLCLTFFAVFNICGIARIVFEAIKRS